MALEMQPFRESLGPCQILATCYFAANSVCCADNTNFIGESMYKKRMLAMKKHKKRKARLKAKMKTLKAKGSSK